MIEYPKYKKVLFCTDFSKNSDCAFDYAFGVAKRDDSILYIMHVIPDNPKEIYHDMYVNKKNLEKIKANIQKNLEKLFEEKYLSQIKDRSNVRVVIMSGRESEEILKFVRKEKIDLITIGTHGRTGIKYAVFGSVAEKIVRRSPIPVFIIPLEKRNGRNK
jgi:nucleotide-binding universal stress UspA family protein